jgi:putative glutamine amidotransferase
VASNGSDPRPRIGVTTYLEPARWGGWDQPAALVPRTYVDAVVRAGGMPLLLPPVDLAAETVIDLLDGLLLVGGADLEPAMYGADQNALTDSVRPDRDRDESRLLLAAIAAGVPVLGICRGAQLVNVAFGGTLHQHLPQRLGHESHRPAPGMFGSTRVWIAPSSRIGRALGDTAIVSCHHHQGLHRLGEGLDVVAWDTDGLVEAVERPGPGFVVGVQWHPEEDADGRALFAALVEAAAAVPARR